MLLLYMTLQDTEGSKGQQAVLTSESRHIGAMSGGYNFSRNGALEWKCGAFWYGESHINLGDSRSGTLLKIRRNAGKPRQGLFIVDHRVLRNLGIVKQCLRTLMQLNQRVL